MTSSSLGAGTAGLTTGTVPMLSRCARTEFAFRLRDGLLVDGSTVISGDPEKLCKTTWQDYITRAPWSVVCRPRR